MSDFKGDYMGFTYNGIHSSDLGIVRTSDGSRFNENLLPTMQDKTVQVPGGDGTYYFGSYYTQKPLSVSFAFDALTEEQIVFLQQHFGDKKVHPLVFDERPYKEYQAKVTGTATIKYIPFTEGKTGRLYKGEGSISFTCFQPYAICKKKYLSDYSDEEWANRGEWAAASGLLKIQGDYDQLKNTTIKIYNPGVKEADWILKIGVSGNRLLAGVLSIGDNKLVFGGGAVKSKNAVADTHITFNSKTGLIEGWNNDIKSGNLYNDYIVSGDFFKIPVTISRNAQGKGVVTDYRFSLGAMAEAAVGTSPLEYNYYYY